MTLKQAVTTAKIIETVQNYSVADEIAMENEQEAGVENRIFYDDEDLWRQFIADPARFWNKKLSLTNVVITEWVPRIPGLFIMQQAKGFRPIPDTEIESRHGSYTTYRPMTKSAIVLQGIGTFVL